MSLMDGFMIWAGKALFDLAVIVALIVIAGICYLIGQPRKPK